MIPFRLASSEIRFRYHVHGISSSPSSDDFYRASVPAGLRVVVAVREEQCEGPSVLLGGRSWATATWGTSEEETIVDVAG